MGITVLAERTATTAASFLGLSATATPQSLIKLHPKLWMCPY